MTSLSTSPVTLVLARIPPAFADAEGTEDRLVGVAFGDFETAGFSLMPRRGLGRVSDSVCSGSPRIGGKRGSCNPGRLRRRRRQHTPQARSPRLHRPSGFDLDANRWGCPPVAYHCERLQCHGFVPPSVASAPETGRESPATSRLRRSCTGREPFARYAARGERCSPACGALPGPRSVPPVAESIYRHTFTSVGSRWPDGTPCDEPQIRRAHRPPSAAASPPRPASIDLARVAVSRLEKARRRWSSFCAPWVSSCWRVA